ncbi:MAG: response regulator [Chloroflexota bacterium]
MQQQTRQINVMIVDDHDMVRLGLRVSIESSNGLRVAAEANNGQRAVEEYRRRRPDVVLMDLIMPEMDGVAATHAIREIDPEARIIALTSFDDDDLIRSALKAGVTSFLLKDVSMDQLAQAVRDAYDGRATLAQKATRVLMQSATGPPTPGHDLTPSERTVLSHVVRGMSNDEIAAALVVSTSTVKKHVSSILRKLDVANRAEAAALAIQYALVNTESR